MDDQEVVCSMCGGKFESVEERSKHNAEVHNMPMEDQGGTPNAAQEELKKEDEL